MSNESFSIPESQLTSEGLAHNLPTWWLRRSLWGTLLLTLSTLGALCVAWAWPDNTVLHYWLVTQALPVFYLGLAAWWAWRPVEPVDEF